MSKTRDVNLLVGNPHNRRGRLFAASRVVLRSKGKCDKILFRVTSHLKNVWVKH